MTKVLFNYK